MTATPPPVISYATPGTPPRKSRALFGWVLFIGLAVMFFLLLQVKHTVAGEKTVSLSDFQEQLEAGNVQYLTIDGEVIRGKCRLPQVVNAATMPTFTMFRTEIPANATGWAFTQWLLEHRNGADVSVENNANLVVNLILPLVPWLLIFAFIWFFVFRQLRAHAGPNRPPQPVYIVQPQEPK
jgi:ATP-dependent Zn protease